ncbi:MAG TPA: prolipoprotein diacylglyceryl transferase [Candidatus Hydrogenedentes bacterium]|nr:prolipoprotein diacylglyceryl transferase [Candidatus Hydrogenedentota bacterium]
MFQAAYPLLAIAGIVLSSMIWSRLLRRDGSGHDYRMELIYIIALCGAFVGAKLVYFLAEGWHALVDPALTREQIAANLLTGKTITGALLGGYVSVELAKKWMGYTKTTGDFFAVVAPFGLMLGRVGCFIQECCPGVTMEPHWYTMLDAHGISRWPAVPLEFAFNFVFFVAAFVMFKRRILPGQLFHAYLIAYGLFRFAHEFLRDTPALAWGITGYHLAAIAIFVLGAARFAQRARAAQALTGGA